MRRIKKLFPQSIKNLYHLAQAILANVRYAFPSRKLKVIGITGSDGKTTTTQMVTRILEEAGKKVAMASTINFRINEQEEKNLSHFTTESAFAVQKFIKKAVDHGCEYLVLETSSHSLDQYRVWGVEYKTAVITNVTREHLDYHKTMERYRLAKKKLFKIVSRNSGTVIVNLDMENPEDFLEFNVKDKFAYSTKKNKLPMTDDRLRYIYAENIELGIQNSKFKIQNYEFILNIPGLFNVENALAAICVALSEGIKFEEASMALEKIKGVPGRMESVPNDRGLDIIVDFALTPNALDKLYGLLVSVKKPEAKVIAIFGSCGERDRGKRPIMGEIVSKYADFVIVTNDEPYHEDPQGIINEIFAGVMTPQNSKLDESIDSPNFQFPISNPPAGRAGFQTISNDQISNDKIKRAEGVNCWRIMDRREAIKKALEIATVGDIIVITGMGNFETMVVGDQKIPWNDRNVIEEELRKLA